jgi:HEAT repeat protein
MTDELRKRIAALLADGDPDARRHAADELSSEGGLAAVAALAAALQDESKGVRDAAARSLLTLGGNNVPRAIVEYIADRNITTRNLASELLVKMGTRSVPAIVPYLQDSDHDVRKFAVDILGLIGSREPVSPMLPLLHDRDENVVVSTVEALGNIGSPESVEELIALYGESPVARATVVEALGKIGEARVEAFLLGELVRSSAMDVVTQFAVVEALGRIGSAMALQTLQATTGSVRGKIRSALLHAMSQIAGRIGTPLPVDPALKPGLIAALGDDDMAVRLSAAAWLHHFPGEDVTAALVRALGGGQELDNLLTSCLAERAETFRSALAVLADAPAAQRKTLVGLIGRLALGFIGQIMRHEPLPADEMQFARAFEAIAAGWEQGDEETRAAIVDTLFRLDGDRAVQFLDQIANDPDPWLRMHVIEVIAAISDRRAPDFIARFLQDDDEMVRDVAMNTLTNKGFLVDPAAAESDG